jgi:hypothetical protein
MQTVKEIEIEINFDAVQAEQTTKHCPGHSEYIEINSLSIYGIELSADITNKILEHIENELIEACQCELRENKYEDAISRLEAE